MRKKFLSIRSCLGISLIIALLVLSLTPLTQAYADSSTYRFSDVPEGAWYANDEIIGYVVDHNLMNGYGNGNFGPNDNVTRGQVAVILYKIAGSPDVTATRFDDVDYNLYYGKAIHWARNTGVVNGYGNTNQFGPEDYVTREQLATMLSNYASKIEKLNVDVGTISISGYSDSKSVSDWARNAMAWVEDKGIMSGAEINGTYLLKPQDYASRCQAAKMVAVLHKDVLAGGTEENNIPSGGTEENNTPSGGDEENNTPSGGDEENDTPSSDMSLPAYAFLYKDGTLVFQRGNEINTDYGEVQEFYTGFEEDVYETDSDVPWNAGPVEYGNGPTRIVFNDIIKPKSTAYWFMGMGNIKKIDGLDRLDTSKVTDMSHMFEQCQDIENLDLSKFNTSEVTDMNSMFYNCQSLESINFSGFDTSNVTDMNAMFRYCLNLKSLDLSGFNTSNVIDMSSMFSSCDSLKFLDLSGFDTSNVTDMGGMFSYSGLESLNLSGFDTSNVTNMSYMFYVCGNVTSLDLSTFDTSKVESMECMFRECENLVSVDLSSFNTSNVNINVYLNGIFFADYSLSTITVGDKFAFSKVGYPSRDHPWKNVVTGELYDADDIPDYVAATYVDINQ